MKRYSSATEKGNNIHLNCQGNKPSERQYEEASTRYCRLVNMEKSKTENLDVGDKTETDPNKPDTENKSLDIENEKSNEHTDKDNIRKDNSRRTPKRKMDRTTKKRSVLKKQLIDLIGRHEAALTN